MSILGSLIISLEAQTASFIDGMTGAAKTAKTVGRDIESSFSQLGSIAQTALAPFGELGRAVGDTLNSIGSNAGGAVVALGKLGGSLGSVGAIAIGAASVGVVALDAGIISLALHAAESAAKLNELAQRTGISVEALSGLGFVGKQVGVDTDVMSKSLEKLSKSAFAAATAPVGAVNAFTRLGVAVRDSEGEIRPVQDLLLDVSEKFSKMPDGVTKTALAMQLFGRGGAALIPVLNEGRAGIEELITTASTLGVVISGQTAEAAHKLEQNMGVLRAASEGFENHLLTALLPSLLAVSNAMVDFLKAPEIQRDLGYLITGLAGLIKFTFATGDAFKTVFDQLAIFLLATGNYIVAVFKAIGDGIQAVFKAGTGDFGGAKASIQAGLAGLNAPIQGFITDSKKTWTDYSKFITSLSAPLPAAKPQRGGTNVDVTSKEGHRDIITEVIGKLRAQTAEEAALATAISEVTANTLLATAAAEAEKTIIETNAKAKRENRQLTEDQKKEIRDLTLLQDAYKEGAKDNKGLEDFIQKTQVQTKSLQALGAAYSSNLPLAIEQAREMEKTAPFAKQITDIQGVITALRNMGASDAVLAPLLASLAQLQQKFAIAKVAVHDLFVAEDTDKWAKAIRDLAAQKEQIDAFIPVALQGAAALREFNIEQQTEKFARDNPALSQQQVNQYRASLRALEDDKLAMSAADKVAASQSFLATQLQISDLTLLRQKEIQAGQDTSATDLLIYQTKTKALTDYLEYYFQAENAQLLGNAKVFDVQQQLIKQWDDAALKAGTFGNRIRAVFNEISLQGKQAGSQIAQAFVSAFDGATGQLAHLLVTGKANFLNVLQSLEEAVLKAGIQKAVGGLLGGIGIRIPGLTPGGQLGLPGNPMHVFVVNSGGIGGPSSLPFSAGGAPTAQQGVVGAVGGESLGLPTGIFTQQLNTMAAAQAVFAGKMGGSWLGITSMFRGAIGLMASLFHIHTAGMIAGQAAQTGAVATSQAAQTAATSAGSTARSNIGLAEHFKAVFRHAAGAAAAVFHKVMEAMPFPLNIILAPVAAAGAFAGVLAWGAIGSAARGALVPEDMLMMTHQNEMVIPGDISEGLQGIIRANQGGFAPSVSDFGGPQRGGAGDEFHAHVHMGDVNAWDTATGADQLKRLAPQMGKQIKQMFKTGYLNPRKLARV